MDCSECDAAEVKCLTWIRDDEQGFPGASLSQSTHFMSPVCKRRSHMGVRRDVGDGRFASLSYSPSSLAYRVRKVRYGNECQSGDGLQVTCRCGDFDSHSRMLRSSRCNGSGDVCCSCPKVDHRSLVSHKLCTAYNATAPSSNKGTVATHVQWPPSALEVLHDPENYVEVNFADYRPLYDKIGPVLFQTSLVEGLKSNSAELRLFNDSSAILISQNSTQRVVYNAYWLPKLFPKIALKVAVKSVKDYNLRDGRSIKREIGCHLYIYQKLIGTSRSAGTLSPIAIDDWPTSELLGYYLDKKNPGMSVLVTRKLFGPDFFDIIRSECSPRFSSKNTPLYELNKLDWCIIALERVAQLYELGIRHNDLKPDNIVLDMYESNGVKRVDVKVIDLGAASMEGTKEFTGGTSWYESPEQKLLEFYTKKHHNIKRAQTIAIDRASDAWGIGQSVIEVLLGRRMVDHMCPPQGSGPPELIDPPQKIDEKASDPLWWNCDEYWTIPPQAWLERIRSVLQLDSPTQKFPICAKAARYVFDKIMRVDPRERASVRSVAEGLRRLVKGEIAKRI